MGNGKVMLLYYISLWAIFPGKDRNTTYLELEPVSVRVSPKTFSKSNSSEFNP